MSRTIMDLNLGTEVWLHETVSGTETTVPYILVKKDSQGAMLLRKYCSDKKRMNSSNSAIYDGCEMDNFLDDAVSGFLSRFPAGELACFQARSISTYKTDDVAPYSISRRCFLLSYGDLFSATTTDLEPEIGAVYSLLEYNQTFDFNMSRVTTDGTTAVNWWLRSPSSAAHFWLVYANGAASSNSASSTGYWCRPVLNVASATVVSPEGADVIYLITDGVTRTIDFKTKILELNNRPTKAIVRYTANNLSNILVQVCNNYGDTNPVWVDATAMTEVTFTNTTKETAEWQIGIRCYGESDGYGYFEEPDVFFTTSGIE